jgi:ribosomal protein S6--L-glutamate ligase
LQLIILCRDETLHGVRRITEEARQRRHQVRILDPYRFLLKMDGGVFTLDFKGKPFFGGDVFMARLGAGISEHSLTLIRHFELAGFLVINSADALENARDKFRTAQLLARAGLPVPRTAFSPDPAYLIRALKAVGGPPVVMKLPRSTQGRGVMYADSRKEAQSIADTMWALERDVIVQEFIDSAKGSDLRIIVVGGVAVGAVRRLASKEEFRSNLHQGGSVRKARLTREAASLAEQAAAVCGLDIAGIDLLEADEGLKVLEVNAAPGFEGFERNGEHNVASRIVEYIESRWRDWRCDLKI